MNQGAGSGPPHGTRAPLTELNGARTSVPSTAVACQPPPPPPHVPVPHAASTARQQPPPPPPQQPPAAKGPVTYVPEIVEDVRTDATGEVVTRRYVTGRLLGQGGFANCYKFTHVDKNRVVAGKVVDKATLAKSRAKQKLLAEIRIHRSLSHHRIVGFDSYFEDRANVYIMLELCPYQTLMELVRRRRRLLEWEAAYWGLQLLDCMRYLHGNGIIHRDLKLGNLFIGSDMGMRVGDFGLATQLTYAGERKKTICGTPNYIAPEILDGIGGGGGAGSTPAAAAGSAPAAAASPSAASASIGHSFEVDVWAFGVILYTLLIGKPPFETTDVKSTYRRIRDVSYGFPPEVHISAAARDLISRILVANPLARPSLVQIAQHDFFSGGDVIIPLSLPVSALTEPPNLSDAGPGCLVPGHVAVQRVLGAPLGGVRGSSSSTGSSGSAAVQSGGVAQRGGVAATAVAPPTSTSPDWAVGPPTTIASSAGARGSSSRTASTAAATVSVPRPGGSDAQQPKSSPSAATASSSSSLSVQQQQQPRSAGGSRLPPGRLQQQLECIPEGTTQGSSTTGTDSLASTATTGSTNASGDSSLATATTSSTTTGGRLGVAGSAGDKENVAVAAAASDKQLQHHHHHATGGYQLRPRPAATSSSSSTFSSSSVGAGPSTSASGALLPLGTTRGTVPVTLSANGGPIAGSAGMRCTPAPLPSTPPSAPPHSRTAAAGAAHTHTQSPPPSALPLHSSSSGGVGATASALSSSQRGRTTATHATAAASSAAAIATSFFSDVGRGVGVEGNGTAAAAAAAAAAYDHRLPPPPPPRSVQSSNSGGSGGGIFRTTKTTTPPSLVSSSVPASSSSSRAAAASAAAPRYLPHSTTAMGLNDAYDASTPSLESSPRSASSGGAGSSASGGNGGASSAGTVGHPFATSAYSSSSSSSSSSQQSISTYGFAPNEQPPQLYNPGSGSTLRAHMHAPYAATTSAGAGVAVGAAAGRHGQQQYGGSPSPPPPPPPTSALSSQHTPQRYAATRSSATTANAASAHAHAGRASTHNDTFHTYFNSLNGAAAQAAAVPISRDNAAAAAASPSLEYSERRITAAMGAVSLAESTQQQGSNPTMQQRGQQMGAGSASSVPSTHARGSGHRSAHVAPSFGSPMAVDGETQHDSGRNSQRLQQQSASPFPLLHSSSRHIGSAFDGSSAGSSGYARVWVTTWIDFTGKYGLGYLLSNGAVGVYFNDATKIVLAPNGSVFAYYDRTPSAATGSSIAAQQQPQPQPQPRRCVGTLSSFNEEAVPKKKVTLLKHFRGYLLEQYAKRLAATRAGDAVVFTAAATAASASPQAPHSQAGVPGPLLPVTPVEEEAMAAAAASPSGHPASLTAAAAAAHEYHDDGSVVYVKKFVRTRRAFVFRLSNSTMQLFFHDGTVCVLTEGGVRCTVMDSAGRRQLWDVQGVFAASAATAAAAAASSAMTEEGEGAARSPSSLSPGGGGSATVSALAVRLRYARDVLSQLAV